MVGVGAGNVGRFMNFPSIHPCREANAMHAANHTWHGFGNTIQLSNAKKSYANFNIPDE